MNKLVSIMLITLATTSICCAKVSIDNVDDAIEQSKLGRLKGLLHRLDREEMTLQKKTKLYDSFYDSACDIVDQRKEAISLIGNWKDLGKMIAGSLLTIGGAVAIGLGILYSGPGDSQIERAGTIGKYFGPPVGLAGLYLFYKGVTCSVQQGWRADAQAIEAFVESRLNEIDGSGNTDPV